MARPDTNDRVFENLETNDDEVNASEDMITYESYIASLINDAVDYDESELSPIRIENTRYYNGDLPALVGTFDADGQLSEDNINRSQAVSTDVKDTVLAILPSLIRIFTSSENVVYFQPSRADQAEIAKQQTDMVNYVFWEECDGFLLLHNVFKDAMINRVGVVKWRTDMDRIPKHKTFQLVSQEQVQALLEEITKGDDSMEVEIVDPESIEFDENGLAKEVTFRYYESKPSYVVEGVPPDEFRINRTAKSVKDALLIGQEYLVTISDLVTRGYELEMVKEYAGSSYARWNIERSERTPGIDTAVMNNQQVLFGEYYVRVDKDGDGIAELRRICTAGDDHHIISDDPAEYVKMALFNGDPTPHTAIGESVADLVKDIQDINSQLLRGSLDSMSQSMFADQYINQYAVNMEDALSDEVGKIVRVNGDPNAAVREFRSTFVGAQVFDMMAQMDAIRQRRTGISEASKGVDPKALQSTNVMGIDAIVSGAQERIELIARILAETGFKDLFRGLLREIVQHPNMLKTFEMRGQWVTVDPSLFDAELRCRVNPTMGKGSEMSRVAALTEVKNTQLMIIEKFGIANQIVTPKHFMNTVSDLLAIANIKDVSRYFGEVTEEMLTSIQTAPKEPTPEELIARAEMEKIKAQTVKATVEAAQKQQEMQLDDDFRRDKLGLDSLVGILGVLSKFPTASEEVAEAEAITARGNTP